MITTIEKFKFKLNEDGFDLDKIDNYLSKSKNDAGSKIELNRLFNEVVSLFKSMVWRQIKFINFNEFYFPILPARISDIIKKMDSLDSAETERMVGLWYNVNNKTNVAVSIEVVTDYEFNRTHIVEGLSDKLKGLGIGYKIYISLIEKLKIVTSADDVISFSGEDSAARLWSSIISPKKDELTLELSDDDLHVVFFNTALQERVMVFVKWLSVQEKKDIITKLFKIADDVTDVDDELYDEILDDTQKADLTNRDSNGKSGKIAKTNLTGINNIKGINNTPNTTPSAPVSNSSNNANVPQYIDDANVFNTNVDAILSTSPLGWNNIGLITIGNNKCYVYIYPNKLSVLQQNKVNTSCDGILILDKGDKTSYKISNSRNGNINITISNTLISNFIMEEKGSGNLFEINQPTKLTDLVAGNLILNMGKSTKRGLIHVIERTVINTSEGERVYVKYNPSSIVTNKKRSISMNWQDAYMLIPV